VIKAALRTGEHVSPDVHWADWNTTTNSETALRYCQARERYIGDGFADVIENEKGESNWFHSGVVTEDTSSVGH